MFSSIKPLMVEKNEHSIVNFCIVFKEKHDELKYMIWLMGINSHKFVYYNHTYCLNFVNYINKKQLKKMFDHLIHYKHGNISLFSS